MPSRRHGTLAATLAALILCLLPVAAQAAAPSCAPAAVRAEGTLVASATFVAPDCRDAQDRPVAPELRVEPAHGRVAARGETFTYSSSAPTGTLDRIGFVAVDPDSGQESQALWVQIGVRTLPRPSCSALRSVSVRPGRVARSPLACVDANPLNVPMTVTLATAPAHGTVDDAALGGGVRYVADPYTPQEIADGVVKPDSVGLSVANAAGEAEPVVVALLVDPAFNNAPTCVGGSRRLQPGSTVEVALTCSDADEDPLVVRVDGVGGGSVGEVTQATGNRPASVRFTAPAGAGSEVELRFTASDGVVDAPVAGYVIAIDPALTNRPPQCASVSLSTVRDESLAVPVRCVDPEGGPVRLSPQPGSARYGTVTGPSAADWDGATFQFLPESGRVGSGGFTLVARDDQNAGSTTTVQVEMEPPRRPRCPAPPTGLAVRPGGTLTGSLACLDAARYRVTSRHAGGRVTVGSDGTWTFAADRPADDRFTVTAYNADDVPGPPMEVAVIVSETVNTAPACTAATPVPGPRSGESLGIQVVCADAEGDGVRLQATASSGGTVTEVGEAAGGFELVFAAGDPGPADVDLEAVDDFGLVSELQVAFEVRERTANTVPVCDATAPLRAYTGRPLVVRPADGCRDADRDRLDITSIVVPQRGSLTAVGGGRFEYLPGETDGADELRFRVDDGFGATTERRFDVAVVVGPETDLDEAPPAITDATAARFRFSAPNVEAAAFQCRLDDAAWETCTSPHDVPGLEDGPHRFEVRATDGADADDTPATATWTVDTEPPAEPTLTTVPAGRVGAAGATIGWTVTEGSAYCALDGADPVPCASPLTIARLPDGMHRLTVSARDAAGNVGAAPEVRWEVDTVGPGAPRLDGAPQPLTNATRVELQAVGSTGTTGFECRVDGAAWTACGVPLVLEGLEDGAHAAAIRGLDDLGNPGAAAAVGWTQDTEAPQPPVLTGVPTQTTNATTLVAAFASASPDVATYRCSLDGRAETGCSSGQRFTGLAEGAHGLRVTAVDGAGNRAAATATWTVDTTPPAAPAFTTRPAMLTDASADPAFAFAAADASRYECRLDGSAWSPCTTTRTLTGLADGQHELSVRAYDTAGNRGAPASVVWWRSAAATIATGTTLTADGVTVTSPSSGALGLLGGRAAPALAGWAAAKPGVLVGAPAASAAAPLRIDLDVPAGLDPAAAAVVLDSRAAAACTAAPGVAGPDPCVAERSPRRITLLTSAPGTVTLMRALPAAEPAPGDDPAPPGAPDLGAPAAPAAPGPVSSPPGRAAGARDVTPPAPRIAVARRGLAGALKRGLPVTVACGEPCSAQVVLRVDGRTARRLGLARRATPVVVGRGAGRGTVAARFTAVAARRLRRARAVALTVRVVTADAAGNRATSRLTARLRR